MTDTPIERGVSPVAGFRLFRSERARNIALGVGGLGTLALVALGIHAGMTDPGPGDKPADIGTMTIAQVTQPPQAPPAEPMPRRPVAAVADAPPAKPAGQPAAMQQLLPIVGAVNYVQVPAMGGETNFDVTNVNPPLQKGEDVPAGGAGASGSQAKGDVTQVQFKSAAIPGAKAGPAMRLTYVMMPGLYPMALETAMDSTLAGAITAHLTQDVLSPDHVLLMPAGTRVVGSYKNDVREGQSRLFSFAGYAITPEGIPVPLDSALADGMGRTGVQGELDSHFWSRFGAGILLAGSQAAMNLAQAYVSQGGNSYFSLNSGGGGADVATEILRQQEQQRPTISVAPGTIVSLVLDHPIDFGDAIKVTYAR